MREALSETDITDQFASGSKDRRRVDLGRYDADQSALSRQKWTAAVASLDVTSYDQHCSRRLTHLLLPEKGQFGRDGSDRNTAVQRVSDSAKGLLRCWTPVVCDRNGRGSEPFCCHDSEICCGMARDEAAGKRLSIWTMDGDASAALDYMRGGQDVSRGRNNRAASRPMNAPIGFGGAKVVSNSLGPALLDPLAYFPRFRLVDNAAVTVEFCEPLYQLAGRFVTVDKLPSRFGLCIRLL